MTTSLLASRNTSHNNLCVLLLAAQALDNLGRGLISRAVPAEVKLFMSFMLTRLSLFTPPSISDEPALPFCREEGD